jgi:hypothetical protein
MYEMLFRENRSGFRQNDATDLHFLQREKTVKRGSFFARETYVLRLMESRIPVDRCSVPPPEVSTVRGEHTREFFHFFIAVCQLPSHVTPPKTGNSIYPT